MNCPKCGFYDVFTPRCPQCGHTNEADTTLISEPQNNLSVQTIIEPVAKAPTPTIEPVEIKKEVGDFINDQGPIVKNVDGSFTINPLGRISLNIYNISYNMVVKLKEMIVKNINQGTREAAKAITPLILFTDLRCKEVDEHVREYNEAISKDKEPQITLFNSPSLIYNYKISETDIILNLIKIYGYSNFLFYVKHSGGFGKIKKFDKSQRDHPKYEKLYEIGLAEKTPGQPGQRDIFKILPFKEPYSGVNIMEFSTAIDYAREMAEIIHHTYTHSDPKNYNDVVEDPIIKKVEIFCICDSRTCKVCRKHAKKRRLKTDPQLPPFHIGCRCITIPLFPGD